MPPPISLPTPAGWSPEIASMGFDEDGLLLVTRARVMPNGSIPFRIMRALGSVNTEPFLGLPAGRITLERVQGSRIVDASGKHECRFVYHFRVPNGDETPPGRRLDFHDLPWGSEAGPGDEDREWTWTYPPA